jgi:hypothetical protein
MRHGIRIIFKLFLAKDRLFRKRDKLFAKFNSGSALALQVSHKFSDKNPCRICAVPFKFYDKVTGI